MFEEWLASSMFFFFQAEDGIRDLTVTGVQTCALPIWSNGRGDIAGNAVRGERPRRCGIRGVRLRRRPRPELRSGRPVHSGSAPHEPAVVSGWRSGPGARPHEESLPPRRALLARGRLLPAAWLNEPTRGGAAS